MIQKLTSRKFWMATAAFLATFALGLTNMMPAEWSALCMTLSAGIYAFCEAYVDSSNAKSTITQITASTTDKTTVAKLLAPAEQEKPAEKAKEQA